MADEHRSTQKKRGTSGAEVRHECLRLFRDAAVREWTDDDEARIRTALECRRATHKGLQSVRRDLTELDRLAAQFPDVQRLAEGVRDTMQSRRVRLAAADEGHHQRDNSLLLALLMRGPVLGSAWSEHAAAPVNTAQDVAVVAILCGIAGAKLKGTPTAVIRRARTTFSKLVDEWAEGRRARLALARALRARGVRAGAELEGLLATLLWHGED